MLGPDLNLFEPFISGTDNYSAVMAACRAASVTMSASVLERELDSLDARGRQLGAASDIWLLLTVLHLLSPLR